MDLSQFYDTFFEECNELLEEIETALLEYEVDTFDQDIINRIFRSAHSIKGGSATFGFLQISKLTHTIEEYLDYIRAKSIPLNQEVVDEILNGVDCIREMVCLLQAGEELSDSQGVELKNTFVRLLNEVKLSGGDTPSPVSSTQQETDNASTEKSSQHTQSEWIIYFKPAKNCFITGNDPFTIFRELEKLVGTLDITVDLTMLPDVQELDSDNCYFSWRIEFTTENMSQAPIDEVFEWVESDSTVIIEEERVELSTQQSPPSASPEKPVVAEQTAATIELPEEVKAPEKPAKKAAAAKTNKVNSSVRVPVEKIDMLVDMLGELVITHSMLGELETQPDPKELQFQLKKVISRLNSNFRDLQECVMSIRMLPIGSIFNRFQRLVRDTAQKVNKNIEFIITGEDTELDKSISEQIVDPLGHLLRNSIDHGIEDKDQRESSGKDLVGKIHLSAYHQGSNIVIKVRDDGKGMDKKVLINKAIKMGIIDSAKDIHENENVYNLIFHPGFSTAESVTDISGRGVGMDVVNKNIIALKGRIDVQSELGTGTTVTIYLPLTLSILEGQLVEINGLVYILPLVSIRETVTIKEEKIHRVAGQTDTYVLRNDVIPIINFPKLLDFNTKEYDNLEGQYMVVIEEGNRLYGILIDDLLTHQQVVVKSLEDHFTKIAGVSSGTILGDGSVALVMDTTDIANLFHAKETAITKAEAIDIS